VNAAKNTCADADLLFSAIAVALYDVRQVRFSNGSFFLINMRRRLQVTHNIFNSFGLDLHHLCKRTFPGLA